MKIITNKRYNELKDQANIVQALDYLVGEIRSNSFQIKIILE